MLALLYREPGGEVVADYLAGAVLSSVNLAEVLQKIRQRSSSHQAVTEAENTLYALGVELQPTLTKESAAMTAEIWVTAHHLGLSLGDRCCLATAAQWPDAFAVTADTAWTELPGELGIEVRCIR